MSNYQIKIENIKQSSPPGTGYHCAVQDVERSALVAERAAARVAERVAEQVAESVWRESEEV